MPIFALIDCNNFYASCERAFNPALEEKPIIVLSNNDGCVISRSNQAKKLGIPMGAPFFKWQAFCLENKVHAFSSNYELYGDMSQRVMTLLKQFCPDTEVYSIDEAFLLLDSFSTHDLPKYMQEIRQKIKTYTGIPVSIGMGPTKTLAKAANYLAKNVSINGVLDLSDEHQQNMMLANLPIKNLWGVGSRLARRLNALGIHSAKDLRDANPKMLRMHSSVTVEKTLQELRGISCIDLETIQPRKQIISSRSFGRSVTRLEELEEALSHYAAIASLKLRRQRSVAAGLSVFLHTSRFKQRAEHYENSISFHFPISTADTRYIVSAAKKCLKHIYRKGYQYQKAGLMLLDLSSDHLRQYDMLTQNDNQKSERVMQTVDRINELMGKNTIFYCAEGIARPWQIRCDRLSFRYTTRWDELLKVT